MSHRHLPFAWISFLLASALAIGIPAASHSLVPRPPEVVAQPIRVSLPPASLWHRNIQAAGVLRPGVAYRARLTGEEATRKGLLVGFFGAGGDPFDLRADAPVKQGVIPLRLIAAPCGTAQDYRGDIELFPDGIADTVSRVRIPIQASIDGGLPSCVALRARDLSKGLLLGLLGMYAFGLYAHSHFLSREQLALRLKPLKWNEGKAVRIEHVGQEIELLVDRELTFWRRAVAWLKANPLPIGLFGRSYYETVQLDLQLPKDLLASHLRPVEDRDLYARLQEDPGCRLGLFATARDGFRLFAVVVRERIGRLTVRGLREPLRSEGPQLVRLHGGEQLLHLPSINSAESPQQGAAGWEV